jgi:hypothetical protein
MSDITIRYWIQTDKQGSRCDGDFEVDREGWNLMSEEEQRATVRECVFEHIEWGFNEVVREA